MISATVSFRSIIFLTSLRFQTAFSEEKKPSRSGLGLTAFEP
jgi:hypothetical protein